MKAEICRAITFVNYHIPFVPNSDTELQYITMGFFDGMISERLKIQNSDDFNLLWEYGIKRTSKSSGRYSYQNVFCFGNDEWYDDTDEHFWNESTDEDYPLTFVIFIQTKNYNTGDDSIASQCQSFYKTAVDRLGKQGKCYAYCTIDKNDFVVCLKCRYYQVAVDVIKLFHKTKAEVVYSYSVFSVANQLLPQLQKDKYPYLFEQPLIDSISLKGITNSFDPCRKLTLDMKYYKFCYQIVHELYDGKEEEQDYKIYDILGDDDFRLIARKVNLGNLLKQYAPGGLLHYQSREFRFYLFSSSLLLNTLTEDPKVIDKFEDYATDNSRQMEAEFCTPICDELKKRMTRILKVVLDKANGRVQDEKTVTFCHAVWQLLQSLMALETAPVKKYDFWSIYHPFSLMVTMLEEKMEGEDNSKTLYYSEINTNEQIYNFIRKISVTLHGTLRTDIQFFQIRDFNVIVHYAPAKLRAFYSLWALQMSDYYNAFNYEEKNEYSFIFSPGLYREISVEQLYSNYKEHNRLMLITVPERQLYNLKWLLLILSHEVSHFVGYTIRKRQERHHAWLKSCVRLLLLEMNYYRYNVGGELKYSIEKGMMQTKLSEELEELLFKEEKLIRDEIHIWPHEFHSDNSMEIIMKAFRNVSRTYAGKLISDDCERMNAFLKKEYAGDMVSVRDRIEWLNEIRKICNGMYRPLLAFNQKFQLRLPQFLKIFRYIYTETYADLIAVLTLELSAEEYLLSFCKGELMLSTAETRTDDGVLLIIRASSVMEAVQTIAKSGTAAVSQKFCNGWTKDIFKRLPKYFSKDKESVEYDISLKIFGYMIEIRDKNKKISIYKSLYNYNDETFSNTKLDFFNDKIIYGFLAKYLNECAGHYINILEENETLQNMKKNFVKIYQKASGGSVTAMVQEIEKFLSQYEVTENMRRQK